MWRCHCPDAYLLRLSSIIIVDIIIVLAYDNNVSVYLTKESKEQHLFFLTMPLEQQQSQTYKPLFDATIDNNPLELEWETKLMLLCIILVASFLALGYVYRLSQKNKQQVGMKEQKKVD